MTVNHKGARKTGAARGRARRVLMLGTLAAASVLSAPVMAKGKAQEGDGNGPAVRTNEGWVRGFTNTSGVNEFLGIPYAAPPVGALRWQPPQPVAPWRNVLNATEHGNVCAQTTTLGVFAGPASVDEDCLYLNVFTTKGVQGGNGKRPVIVWIHGGGNVDGVSNDYDGSKLATGGPTGVDTVVVTINYRLGLFGFLSHPAIDSEGHLYGNYGILDIQAALRWVQRNIDQFGGDPTRVTLGGQSAGASDTGANVLSPLAAGLFHRALFESSPTSTVAPMSVATPRGQNFAAAAGCAGSDASTAACLRALSAAQILQLQGTANANGPYVNGPMVDGTIIPITPETAWTTGRYNHMPMMGGNVQDEGNFTIGINEYFSGPPQVPMTADQFTTLVTAAYSGNAGPGGSPPAYPPGTAQSVLAQYPVASYGSPALAYDAVTTDPGACRAVHVDKLWAPQVPVYAYEFNYQNAPYYFPPMPGFAPLAAHTIDIQFLFPLWHGGILGVSHPLNAAETTLSDQLVAAWTNFAATGNPNGTGNAPWPQFTASSPVMLSQNIPLATWTADQFSQRHKCDFWNQVLVY
jgi:para-nitrobenzyl esterase